MVRADISGIAFSVDPNGYDREKIVIEAVSGLGEKLVRGGEAEFTATVDKSDLILLKRGFSENKFSRLLSISQVVAIAESVRNIERTFGYPVDIEWSFEGSELYILQARPVTGMKTKLQDLSAQNDLPQINGYELTFKVAGLSFLFSDMLVRGFGYLQPLLTSRDGAFRQYFPNSMMEYAAKEGYKWLSRANGFSEYEKEFTSFHLNSQKQLQNILLSKTLSIELVNDFFEILFGYFSFYSKTDFQFTNLTYLYAEEEPLIKGNLELLAQFKDVARVWINNVSIDEDSVFAKLLSKLEHQTDVQLACIEQYKISEIKDLLSGKEVSDEEIKGRRNSYSIYFQNGDVKYLTGSTSSQFVQSNEMIESKLAAGPLAGQVANRTAEGSIQGTVRKINVDYGDLEALEKQISEMGQGEILVAEFTAPELMSACKKAKALVTDLGGMLSHAAIISRELGIPCIVGTKSATKALTNGDIVVLDMRYGHIEKIDPK
jgi:phosphohistidine swiveling domain-containing protein